MNGGSGASASLHFGRALLPGGWAEAVRLTFDGGLITAIETEAAPRGHDERHTVALPGLANLHSHAFQRGMAGLAEVGGGGEDSFWTWREVMYRFVERLTPDDLAAIAAQAYVEMLESGFTRVGEFHYLHHDRDGARFADPAEMSAAIAHAAAASGIGLTLLPVFYAHGGFGGAASGPAQRRFVHDLDGFATLLAAARAATRALPDAVVGVAPHSLRAVTPAELTALADMAPEGPIHIHIAEQMREVEACLAWSGRRPVEWLLGEAAVDARWCLVHATHMDAAETDALARSGAVAGLCPITEANLGDGLFPGVAFVGAGGRYGIGSDSNVLIDATEELRLLEYGQRLADRGRNRLGGGAGRSTGATLYRAALAGGARAVAGTPGIAVGGSADLVSLDVAHPAFVGRGGDALIDALLFASGRAGIDAVWRRGERLVAGGRHRDRAPIAARYRRVLERLLG